jgi:hypothetical protein
MSAYQGVPEEPLTPPSPEVASPEAAQVRLLPRYTTPPYQDPSPSYRIPTREDDRPLDLPQVPGIAGTIYA